MNNVHEKYGIQWVKKRKKHQLHDYHVKYQNFFLSKADCSRADRVLECGSGCGDIIQRIIDSDNCKSSTQFTSLDVSKILLQEVNRNLKLKPNMSLCTLLATSERIPIKDDTFDTVYSLSVTWYIPDIENAVREMYRVLKPGGILVFDVMSTYNLTGMVGRISNFITRLFSKRYKINYINPKLVYKIFPNSNAKVKSIGFMPFLPTSLPVLGNLLNVFNYFNILPKVENRFLQSFCNKVVYIIEKPEVEE